MITDFLDALACPQCEAGLSWQPSAQESRNGGGAAEDSAAGDGWLVCETCVARTPVMRGIVFFTETDLDAAARPSLAALCDELMGSDAAYRQYIEQKRARDVIESYAGFTPFNESTRSPYPILNALRGRLPENGVVLDLWNRTGWSGDWLAGSFPAQRVIAFWEGDNSVLGYRGFGFWFAHSRRRANLLPVFSPPGAPLPIRKGSAALLHAYDTLHRYRQPAFLNACITAAAEDATVLFPHIHLSNSEPEPWFDRGGTQRHGRLYHGWLCRRLGTNGREARVFGEPDAFGPSRFGWRNEPETTHYNGFAAIAPTSLFERLPDPEPGFLSDDGEARMIVNPLLRLNPLLRRIELRRDGLGGQGDHIFERHPVYEHHLTARARGRVLSDEELQLLSLAEEGVSLRAARQAMESAGARFEELLRRLVRSDIVITAPISPTMFRLQHDFHCNGQSIFDSDVERVWREWVEEAPGEPALSLFGEPVMREEADQIVQAITAYLVQNRVENGTFRTAPLSSEPTLALAWMACALIGLVPAAAHDDGSAATLSIKEGEDGDIVFDLHGNSAPLSAVLEAHMGEAPLKPAAGQRGPVVWSPELLSALAPSGRTA